jgi:hypothetical protein
MNEAKYGAHYTDRCKLAKKSPYPFRKDELREGCSRCIDNVKGLLPCSSLLLGNRESIQYVLGLYVYAVEEFGKTILLKKYMTGKKKKCHIPAWILGGGKPSIVSIETDSILSELLRRHISYRKWIPDTIPPHDAKLFN